MTTEEHTGAATEQTLPLQPPAIQRNAEGKFIIPGGDVPLRTLFAGTAKAPDLSRGPTRELDPFFQFLEATVVSVCDATGRDETDQEMHRIYAQLRRRPDGKDCLMYACLQAAARMYMSHRTVSQAEYEAVMGRLSKSAKTFSSGHISRNDLGLLRETFSFA
jgi:hypothetical protein